MSITRINSKIRSFLSNQWSRPMMTSQFWSIPSRWILSSCPLSNQENLRNIQSCIQTSHSLSHFRMRRCRMKPNNPVTILPTTIFLRPTKWVSSATVPRRKANKKSQSISTQLRKSHQTRIISQSTQARPSTKSTWEFKPTRHILEKSRKQKNSCKRSGRRWSLLIGLSARFSTRYILQKRKRLSVVANLWLQ